MLVHRVDSIKEQTNREAEAQALKDDISLAMDCIAEIGVLIAPLIEAQEGGTDDGGTDK